MVKISPPTIHNHIKTILPIMGRGPGGFEYPIYIYESISSSSYPDSKLSDLPKGAGGIYIWICTLSGIRSYPDSKLSVIYPERGTGGGFISGRSVPYPHTPDSKLSDLRSSCGAYAERVCGAGVCGEQTTQTSRELSGQSS